MHWNVAPMHFLDLQGLYVFWTAGVTTVYKNITLVIVFCNFGKEQVGSEFCMTSDEERYPDEVDPPLLYHFTCPSHCIKILVYATQVINK